MLDLITLVTLLQSGILILKPPHITWKIFEHLVRLQHYYWGRKDTSQLRKKVNRVATEVLKDIADQHHLDYKVHTLRDMKKRVSGPLKKAIERIDEETQKLLPNVIFVNNWFAQHIISRRWAGLRKDAREVCIECFDA